MTGPMTDPRLRTDRFRQGAKAPALLAVLTGALMVLLIFAVLVVSGFDTNSTNPIWAGAGIVFLGGIFATALWLLRHDRVMPEVGPDGLYLPSGWRQPLACPLRTLGQGRMGGRGVVCDTAPSHRARSSPRIG